MASAEQAEHDYYAGVDIETTGPRFVVDRRGQRDELISIGIAVFDAVSAPKSPPVRVELLNLNLHKMASVPWEALWRARGYNMATFEEFWATYTEELESTQSSVSPDPVTIDRYVLASSREELARELNHTLVLLEANYPGVRYVTDTTEFDRTWLATLLQEHGYHSMAYTRAGNFRGGASDQHSGSFELGVINYTSKDEEGARATIDTIRGCYAFDVPHSHRADQDATSIGAAAMAAVHEARRRAEFSQ
jgi:hypothetical protein